MNCNVRSTFFTLQERTAKEMLLRHERQNILQVSLTPKHAKGYEGAYGTGKEISGRRTEKITVAIFARHMRHPSIINQKTSTRVSLHS